ncbi:unnamed protein product [Darwinula stevensoni]|uniref:DNA topoisomerase n=1 Tax=Darwinula stevensoni TaxID=69355 RepID=A0A7R9ACG4_9CRUS|nr:unnamed protein product [Darwinula stevensoni]CAG0900333.1 unnamed protein product [Darwinula stevensoni]
METNEDSSTSQKPDNECHHRVLKRIQKSGTLEAKRRKVNVEEEGVTKDAEENDVKDDRANKDDMGEEDKPNDDEEDEQVGEEESEEKDEQIDEEESEEEEEQVDEEESEEEEEQVDEEENEEEEEQVDEEESEEEEEQVDEEENEEEEEQVEEEESEEDEEQVEEEESEEEEEQVDEEESEEEDEQVDEEGCMMEQEGIDKGQGEEHKKEKRDNVNKWESLHHEGPLFAPKYEKLPENIKLIYDGKPEELSLPAEEVATFYAKILDDDCTKDDTFNQNFFTDWRKVMTDEEQKIITNLKKCSFKAIHKHFLQMNKEKKNMSNEEKQKLKEQKEDEMEKYGFCLIDDERERIGNFKIEPAGLFRGRGENPKRGKLKVRITPEDVIINCSKDSKIPEPPPSHEWEKVVQNQKVTWLARWTDKITRCPKYVKLSPSSNLMMEKDRQKFDTARRLHKSIDTIRENYWKDMESEEVQVRQRGVAIYLIDQLALRVGNEKTQKKRLILLAAALYVASIPYRNEVYVDKRVFQNMQNFMNGKKIGDKLFDQLSAVGLNDHLKSLMEGLTAKVFRTYRASQTLQEKLDELTDPNAPVEEKFRTHLKATQAVANLCNHQRSNPKIDPKSIKSLEKNVQEVKRAVQAAKNDLQSDKKTYNESKDMKNKVEKKKKVLLWLKEKLSILKIKRTLAKEGKERAPEVSKLYYLDPRITVAWSKKHSVPIDVIFTMSQKEKFHWAISGVGPNFRFDELD